MPVAIVGFDSAEPGARAHDPGYAAWLWLDIGSTAASATEQVRRPGVFPEAYGPEVAQGEVIGAMLVRQTMLVARGRETGDLATSGWARTCQA